MIKLSYIVPIYNVEQYLRKCVESLLLQDYPADQYEIILVDDGSTDGSGDLADSLANNRPQSPTIALSPKIHVIHRENGGLSAARNSGIEVARGEYLCFVDSDDYWEENVLGGLMAQIERDNLDVLRFRWQNVRILSESESESERLEYRVFKPYKEENFVDFSSEPLKGLDYLNQRMGIQCYAWSFICKHSLLVSESESDSERRECIFTEGILFEDTDWTPRMLVRANRVAGTETIVYNYLWRESGITLSKSPEKLRKELNDKIALAQRLKTWGNSKWYKQMIGALVVSAIGILSQGMYNERKKYIKQLQEAHILPLTPCYSSKSGARKIKLTNLSPKLAIYLLHIKNG